MTCRRLLLVGLAVAVLPVAAQQPTPGFEVASIKPNAGPSPFSGANIRRDSFSATYYSVSQVASHAYGQPILLVSAAGMTGGALPGL